MVQFFIDFKGCRTLYARAAPLSFIPALFFLSRLSVRPFLCLQKQMMMTAHTYSPSLPLAVAMKVAVAFWHRRIYPSLPPESLPSFPSSTIRNIVIVVVVFVAALQSLALSWG